MSEELTPRQERFCREYLIDLNITQAAIRTGYSKNSASEQGSRLLGKVRIQNRIAELKAERSNRVVFNGDKVVLDLIKMFRTNVKDVSTWTNDGIDIKPDSEIDEDTHRAIQSIKIRTTTRTMKDGSESVQVDKEVKLVDKNKTADMLMRHFGEYEKDNSQSSINVNNLSPDVLEKLRDLKKEIEG